MKKLFFVLFAALIAGTLNVYTMSVSILGNSYSNYEDFVSSAIN